MLSAHLHLAIYRSHSSSLQLCISIHFKGISTPRPSSTQRCDLPLIQSHPQHPRFQNLNQNHVIQHFSPTLSKNIKFYPPLQFHFPTQNSRFFFHISTTIVCPSAPRHLFVIIRHTSHFTHLYCLLCSTYRSQILVKLGKANLFFIWRAVNRKRS